MATFKSEEKECFFDEQYSIGFGFGFSFRIFLASTHEEDTQTRQVYDRGPARNRHGVKEIQLDLGVGIPYSALSLNDYFQTDNSLQGEL